MQGEIDNRVIVKAYLKMWDYKKNLTKLSQLDLYCSPIEHFIIYFHTSTFDKNLRGNRVAFQTEVAQLGAVAMAYVCSDSYTNSF